jgi:hypothetical protein
MPYTIEDINVGDQVAFVNTPQKNNRDLFWKVVQKSGNKLVIELKKYVWDENWTIEVDEVIGLLKRSQFQENY